MTTPATSSSDRIDAARAALDALTPEITWTRDLPGDNAHHLRVLLDASDALLALIAPPATLEAPEQIATRVWHEGMKGEHSIHDLMVTSVRAGIQAAWESWEPDTSFADGVNFAPEGEPDKFRDLWNENMPRVSGRMYFSIPGEQPIHVTDEQARRLLVSLSTEERN